MRLLREKGYLGDPQWEDRDAGSGRSCTHLVPDELIGAVSEAAEAC